ncbi:hypothetical protein E2C01_033238 [Portunus trituberculatus]|uniref:Uncharacterized protein n=1 Tax=Portunus trituberculatus TaxID=210409 RepID=A0A5B7F516_PORTR|nr:hypothetical protein [Portunus trituberculatus]
MGPAATSMALHLRYTPLCRSSQGAANTDGGAGLWKHPSRASHSFPTEADILCTPIPTSRGASRTCVTDAATHALPA